MCSASNEPLVARELLDNTDVRGKTISALQPLPSKAAEVRSDKLKSEERAAAEAAMARQKGKWYKLDRGVVEMRATIGVCWRVY